MFLGEDKVLQMLWILMSVLQPRLDKVQELILVEVLRAVILNTIEHGQEVLFDPFMRSMMQDVDTDRHFLPESGSAFLPQLNLMGSLKWGSEEINT